MFYCTLRTYIHIHAFIILRRLNGGMDGNKVRGDATKGKRLEMCMSLFLKSS